MRDEDAPSRGAEGRGTPGGRAGDGRGPWAARGGLVRCGMMLGCRAVPPVCCGAAGALRACVGG